MLDGAGFAVALTLRQQLLQDALLIAYANSNFPRTLNTASFPGGLLPGGPPDVGLNVFLGPPTITSNTGNTLTLSLEIWGRISVTMTIVRRVAQIYGHLTITIVPAFVVSGAELELSLTPENVTVTQWTFAVIPPSSLPTDANAYLGSTAFIARLQTAIHGAIALGIITLPKIDISFLGSLVAVVNMTAASRARQGAVLIGLNIQWPGLELIGNVDLLADFAGTNDLAAFINAQAIPLLFQGLQNEIIKAVADNGATLQGDLSIGCGTGKFLISGRASRTGGSANFSFSAVPTLFAAKPGANFQYLKKPFGVKPRTWPALGFAIADVHVDIDPSNWVYVVTAAFTVLNFGVPLLVADFISGISAQITFAIQSASTITPVPRVQHLPPSTPGGPMTRVELTAYDISAAGTFIGATLAPQAPPAMLIGLTSIPANFIGQTLNYSVRLPLGLGTDDPALRIRWTVIDAVSGNVLANQDGPAAGRDTFGFSPATVGAGLTQLRITVRVYRPFGTTVTDFVNDGITLSIGGPLPVGAYVRWYYDVKNPNVRFDDTANTWVYTGDEVVKRHSNYHRTDKPCAMAARHSRYTYRQDLLDSLPFSVSEIALHRAELCDYCFYGGPAGVRPSL
jgi:hypothetical protein